MVNQANSDIPFSFKVKSEANQFLSANKTSFSDSDLESKTSNVAKTILTASDEFNTGTNLINNIKLSSTPDSFEELNSDILSLFEQQTELNSDNDHFGGLISENEHDAKKTSSFTLTNSDASTLQALEENITQSIKKTERELSHHENLLKNKVVVQKVINGYVILDEADKNQSLISQTDKDFKLNGFNPEKLAQTAQYLGKIKPATSTESAEVCFDEKLISPKIKGAIFKRDLKNLDINDLDFNNIPTNIPIHRVGKLTAEDKKEINTLLHNYFNASLELHLLENQLQLLMNNLQKPREVKPEQKEEKISGPRQNHATLEPHTHRKKSHTGKKSNAKNIQNITQKENAKKAQELKHMRRQREEFDKEKSSERLHVHENKLFNQELITQAHLIADKKINDIHQLEKNLQDLNSCFKKSMQLTEVNINFLLDLMKKNQINFQENNLSSILLIVEEHLKPQSDKSLIRKIKRFIKGLNSQETP